MQTKHIALALGITLGFALSVSAADKSKKDSKAKSPDKPKIVSVFADKNLEQAVRRQVFSKRDNEEPLTAEDVAQVAVVNGRSLGIKSLAGLEHCRALASLDLADNAITNLAPLQGLPRLQQLILNTNQVTSLAPLKANLALQYLDLNHNAVADLAPLSGLTNLAVLYLSDNRVKTITPITKLPKLHSLYLDRNGISEIAGLSSLRWLSSFSAAGNQITDLKPLDGLANLSFLFLENNQITDLKPLLDALKKDYEGDQRFAPYLNLYLKGNPLGKASLSQMEQFRKLHRTRFK